MAGPRLTLAVLALVLCVITLAEGMRGPGPRKCCFNFIERQLPREKVVGYTRTSQRCPNPGVLLERVAGRRLCARPTDSWVKDIISYLDTKMKPGEQTNL